MRRTLILLTPLLLAGCIKDSTSYYINGSEHALTLRAEQDYFWDDSVTLAVTAARLPDCQRQFVLAKVPAGEVALDLFNAGENVYNLRAGSQSWQIDTQNCTENGTPDAKALGEPVGSFSLNDDDKLVFQAATPAAAATTATAAAEPPAQ